MAEQASDTQVNEAASRISATKLPSYSSERYYLLSELKMDGVIINCADGSIVQETMGVAKVKKPNFSLVYLVWEQKDGLGGLTKDIGRLLKSKVKAAGHSRCAIFIESHAPKEEVKEPKSLGGGDVSSSIASEGAAVGEAKKGPAPLARAGEAAAAVRKAQDLLRYLDTEYPKIHARVIGVSDSTAACPALDECVNFVKMRNAGGSTNYSGGDISKGAAKRKRRKQQPQGGAPTPEETVYEFVIRDQVDMLGIDGHKREPDAVGDVVQYVVGDSCTQEYFEERDQLTSSMTEQNFSSGIYSGIWLGFFSIALAWATIKFGTT